MGISSSRTPSETISTDEFGKRPQTTDAEFVQAEKEVRERVQRLLSINGKRTVDSFHRELGHIMWDKCGMARTKESLEEAIAKIPQLREEFWSNVSVLGSGESFNHSLEKAGRVADFLEFGELLCRDALDRNESCGGHFRAEFQTPDGEALRDDEHYAHVSAWQFQGEGAVPVRQTEPLVYEKVKLATRSYK